MSNEPSTPSNREHVLAAAVATAGWIRARRASWTAVPGKEAPKAAAPPAQSYIEPPVPAPTPVEIPRIEAVPPVLVPVAPEPVWSPPEPAWSPPPEPAWSPPPEPEWAPPSSVPAARDIPPEPEPEPELDDEPEPFAMPTAQAKAARRSDQPSMAARVAGTAADLGGSVIRALPRVAALAIVIGLVAAGVTYWPRMRSAMTNGVAVLESVPPGSEAFVDGNLVGTTPVTIELPAGTHEVEFRNGTASRTAQVVVTARGRVVEQIDWLEKPTGGLQVNSEPKGASVLVDGIARGKSPLTIDGLSPGAHTVTLESAEGTIKRTVRIEVGKMAQLNESIYAGWVAVFSPIELTISEGGRALTPDERGRIMLSPGGHKLRLQNRSLGYDEVRSVEIDPAGTTALNVAPQTTLNVTSTEPAEVSIDGTVAGETPLTGRRIPLGSHVIVVRTPAGGERRVEVTATGKPVQLEVDFSKP